ncbi:MAG TPA: CheR family methyltransferase, partial [Chryseosolibacter sp.]|nr:CheR family methyltransferase [Chryseosolibacter sp.]
ELKLKVIPEIINSKTGSDSVKIWSAACSTGEEAYSIAILIKEHFKRLKIDLDVKIFASDTNKESIDFASKGSYPESIAADVPRELLDQYFIREGKKYKVVPQIRKMIVFSHHDLLKDPPFGRLDLVCCRNMLIYLSPHLQRRVMSVFHFALNMGGYLFLGPSETIGELKESMIEVSKKWKIYKNVKPAKSIGLDTLPYTDQVNRKFTHPGTTVHKELSRKGIVESVLNKVLEECALAGALVDSNCNILETFGDYRKYLHLPEKKFDHNLLKMLPARTSIIIAANFRQAIVSQEKQIVKSLPLKKSQPPATITIKPFKDHFNNTVALVLFKDVAVTEQKETVEVSNGQRFHEEVVPDFHHFITLQNELRETKEILQKAIEEAETTNEELQSSNEELISSNEELQSANEELQSLNEELHTVNAENQMKIKEISELNDDLNNYFRSTHIGQVFVDRSLLIRKYTPAATALINLIETDVGRPINHISNNIAYTGLVNDIHHVLKTAESVDKTIEDEHDTCYQMKILPYLREGKYIDGAVLIFVNITAIKKAEKALEKANADLKELNETLLQSNKELEQFAYITSHDLQEPLRKIQTFADLTARNILDQDASKKYLEKINQSAIRMSLLIKDILSYSRLTLSNESFCDVSLGNLLKSVVEDFELLIEQKQATVIIDVRHIVRGVPLQLHQLFSNLLSNSLKFCERNPEITIVTAPVSAEEVAGIPELSPRNEYIRISFSDNGIGFEQEYATKIFTIFQRLHHRKLYAGTGIGLALCKRIVEKHQGTIFASSKIDCGATFTIYLVAA